MLLLSDLQWNHSQPASNDDDDDEDDDTPMYTARCMVVRSAVGPTPCLLPIYSTAMTGVNPFDIAANCTNEQSRAQSKAEQNSEFQVRDV